MGLSKQKCPFLCGWHSQGGYSGFQVTGMIKWGQNKPQNKFGCTLFAELLSWNTQPLPRIFRLFWIPKKILAEFSYPKNPGIENVKPKKSFDHPRHSKSRVPPGWTLEVQVYVQCKFNNSNNNNNKFHFYTTLEYRGNKWNQNDSKVCYCTLFVSNFEISSVR